jgi:outer membrane protein assembly factor BamD
MIRMIRTLSMRPRRGALVAAIAALTAAGCGSRAVAPAPGTSPDKFLFDRGEAELKERRWLKAREYFRQIVDNYPQSAFRPDAKLGVGQTYLGEGSTESLLLAANEFKEFLTYYPTNPRADYAQYQLALVHHKQMLRPERDQTQTREALRELQTFVERYPNSALMPEVRAKLREVKDRLSDSEYHVGFFYYRARWYPGAIERLKAVLKADPEYTHRDAVYYHLGESLARMNRGSEALPYFERLLREFEQSEYLELAKKRTDELKAAADGAKPPGGDVRG